MILRSTATKGPGRCNVWFVYILKCRGGSLYTGITNNLKERVDQHNAGQAAAWTRTRRPVRLIFAERHTTKSAATRRELEIKAWRREKKLALVRSTANLVQR